MSARSARYLGLAAALVATATPASAGADAQPDWATGRLTATGVGLADRHAPSPAVARGPARRKAEQAARDQLAIAARALPLATGGTLGARLGDARVGARFERAVAGAIAIDAELETDGSWRVTMALPVEAIRQVLTGPRALTPAGDAATTAGPPVVIVEGVTASPAVGYTVGGLAAPTLWVDKVPAWAKAAPRIQASGAVGGAITAPVGDATLSTLFVIVAPRPR